MDFVQQTNMTAAKKTWVNPELTEQPRFNLTLDVSALREPIVTYYCITHLRRLGYAVTPPNEKWETPAQFNKRLGVSKYRMPRALKRDGCPHALIHRGPTGRVAELCSNAAFDAFVLKYKS